MIDLHTHVLPGIDDGSQSMDMSLEMLARRTGWSVFSPPEVHQG